MDLSMNNQLENIELEGGTLPVPISVATWLRKRGKTVRPELTKQQRAQMLECFNLIDDTGSGSIGVTEMAEAFRFMGINLSNKEFLAIITEVDRDGSGAIEYDEFTEIMTSSLERHIATQPGKKDGEDAAEEGAPGQQVSPGGATTLPFPLLATAYRRKKLLNAMFSGDATKRAEMADQANRALAEVAKLKQEEEASGLKAKKASIISKKQQKLASSLKLPRVDLRMLGINPDSPLASPQASPPRAPATAAGKVQQRRQYGLSVSRPGKPLDFEQALPLPNIRTYNFSLKPFHAAGGTARSPLKR